MHVIFVTGPPWSGKTTQSLLLAKQLGYEYCSPVDWLRIERDFTTPLGTYITSNYGPAAIDPLVTEHVAARVKEATQLATGIIVDGFPRTASQTEALSHVAYNNPYLVVELSNVSQAQATLRGMAKQWAPPIGSLPKLSTADDDKDNADYHVLTVDDTIRRYNGFVASYVRPQHPIVVVDGGIEQELVTRAISKEIGCERQYAIVPTLIEPDRQPPQVGRRVRAEPAVNLLTQPQPATVIETAVAIQMAMQLTGRPEARRRFVGSHPVSLRRCDLQTLTQHNYMVSQKWDGERKMLLLHSGRMWVLGRDYSVLRSRWSLEVASERWEHTLLDCEWLPKTGSLCIIDCLVVGGENVMQRPLLERLHASREAPPMLGRLLPGRPRASGLTCSVAWWSLTRYARSQLGIDVHFQTYYALADMRYLLMTADGKAATDGVVFTSQHLSYKAGRDPALFKWKDAASNTVDLLVDMQVGRRRDADHT
jgi:adenylate kinase